ncbi:VanW family protein, partial [Isoptericola cucumis]
APAPQDAGPQGGASQDDAPDDDAPHADAAPQADAPDGAGAQEDPQPAVDAEPEDDTPYQPSVRAYEQRVVATVAAPSATGSPTQALPVVPASPPAADTSTGITLTPPPPPAVPPGSGTAGDGAGAPADPPGGGETGSPLDGLSGDGAPSRAPKVALWAGLGVVVLAGAYAAAQWAVADTVPKETTVAGVEIGGMTEQEAAAALTADLGPRAAEPIPVEAGEASSTLDPAKAGLTFDAAATVDDLTGFSLAPARLWDHVVGGGEVAPVVDVDAGTLDAAVDGLQEALVVEPVDGTVAFKGAKPVATDAVDGSQPVADEAGDVLTSSWLVTTSPVELPTEPVAPKIDQDATDAALAQAEKVTEAPVTVQVGGQSVELPERALAKATSFEPKDGALTPQFDGEQLVSAVVARTDDLLTEPDDAHFEFSGGKPVVVGGATGTTLDPEATAKSVGKAALGDDRSVELELTEQDPEYTKAALEGMGVKEVVSEFSTPLTSDTVRTQNLIRGAQLVTGTFIAPGDTFSLVDTLSPITLENGYVASGVVSNGMHTEGVGGGLSQMATTTYNAGFFAGYDDAGHQPHSYWFTRYPAGREATIYVGSIDMKFTNDTPYGAVMQSWVSGGELHVAVWSTEYYDVKTSASPKRNVVPTTTVHQSGPECEYYPAGQDGFSITNYRKVSHDGKVVKDESYNWTYKPDNGIQCDEPKADRGSDRDDGKDDKKSGGDQDQGDDAGRDESSGD